MPWLISREASKGNKSHFIYIFIFVENQLEIFIVWDSPGQCLWYASYVFFLLTVNFLNLNGRSVDSSTSVTVEASLRVGQCDGWVSVSDYESVEYPLHKLKLLKCSTRRSSGFPPGIAVGAVMPWNQTWSVPLAIGMASPSCSISRSFFKAIYFGRFFKSIFSILPILTHNLYILDSTEGIGLRGVRLYLTSSSCTPWQYTNPSLDRGLGPFKFKT
jgi:hypothetical protein